jgi:hypothetical protein
MTHRQSIAVAVLMAMCLATSAGLAKRLPAQPATAGVAGAHTTSSAALRRLSLGYDGLIADVYWARAVQYFGERHHQGAQRFDDLGRLLKIAVELDPHLLVAYEFAAASLAPPPPNGAGQPEEAVQLLEFGVQHNPEEWRLYYALGFVHSMERHDYANAARAFERGSLIPGAHPLLRVLGADMAEHAGDRETARRLWVATLETSKEEQVRENARARLRVLGPQR